MPEPTTTEKPEGDALRTVTGPSAEELKPSKLHQNLMAQLLTWQRESAKTFWIVGKPIETD